MPDSKAKLLRFPPLTHAPRWATAAPPHPDTLRALQQIVVDEQEHLAHLLVILNISPAPGSVRLHRLTRRTVLRDQVLEDLRSMEYPADLTSWIDTARTLARQASDALDDCFRSINYLRSSTQGTSVYVRKLDAARRSGTYAYRYSQTLSTHFEQLLQRMAEQAGEQATAESEEHPDTEPMCRITYLADVVGHL